MCYNNYTRNGCALSWVDEIRYLGVYIVRSTKFKCSTDHAKRSFSDQQMGFLGK